MANRFAVPFDTLVDPTGAPYAGGSLTFYASGTTTPLNTYQDRALTIANPNPVVLDSAGRFQNVFLQNLAYKVVLQDVNNNTIWTADPVYASDFSTVAQVQGVSGSPNGQLAGTAASATIPASQAWDFVNNILYVCTQTGSSSTAVWTAINASTAANVVPPPQGYLTLTSGTPIISSDVTGATSVFYTPYVGNLIPIYNGTSFTVTVFSEIFCTLVSAHAASTLYDFFMFNNSGVLTLVTGPAWSNSAAGAGARGTGANTTQLSRINGIWVNTVSIQARNGSSTFTIPANQGTYVGSLFVDGSAGQVSCHLSYGQNRKWGISNTYNRVPVVLKAGDPASTWSYNSSTIRASNNNSANSLTWFNCLAEERGDFGFIQRTTNPVGTGAFNAGGGIAYNSITTFSGTNYTQAVNTAGNSIIASAARYIAPPSLGINTITALESGNTNVPTFFGTEANMLLTAAWRA